MVANLISLLRQTIRTIIEAMSSGLPGTWRIHS